MKDNEIVCIPGLRQRPPREISRRNLAAIIEARMMEIIELVYYEIKNSGHAEELVGGIVLTGGGAMLKHVAQLFEYVTGISCRIGYPDEHLAELPEQSITSPSFSTGVGLVLKGYEESLQEQSETPQTAPEALHESELLLEETIGTNFLNRIKRFFEADDEFQD